MMTILVHCSMIAADSLPWLRRGVAAALAWRRQREYDSVVPEKEGAGLGRLNTQSAQTALRGFFTCVCLRVSPMSGGGGEAFGLAGFFGYQSTNLVICRSPRLVAGRGVTATQGGHYA